MPTKVPTTKAKVAAAYVPARRQATSKMIDNALAVLTRGVMPALTAAKGITHRVTTTTTTAADGTKKKTAVVKDIVIPPVINDTKIPSGATCQEASMHSRERYIPCGNIATSIVHHTKDKRSYYMCYTCADHNVRNRGGVLKFQVALESMLAPTGRLGTSKPKSQDHLLLPPLGKRRNPQPKLYSHNITTTDVLEDLTKRSKNPFADRAPAKSDAFPLVSVLSQPHMNRVIEIMKDDTELAEEIEGLTAARKKMKAELVEIATETGYPGFKWGPFVAYARGMKTKRTFSASKAKTVMVEAGVDASLLDACYTESDPFPDVRIVDTSRPRKGRAASGGDDDDE